MDLSIHNNLFVELEGRAQQRAATFAGFYLAGATAMGLHGVNAISSNSPDFALVVGSFVTATGFYLGACLCGVAAWPGIVYGAGMDPERWDWASKYGGDIGEVTAHEIDDAEESYQRNKATATKSRRWFNIGGIIGLISPLIGLIAWALHH